MPHGSASEVLRRPSNVAQQSQHLLTGPVLATPVKRSAGSSSQASSNTAVMSKSLKTFSQLKLSPAPPPWAACPA